VAPRQHPPAFGDKQLANTPVAVAAIPHREPNDVCRQRRFVVRRLEIEPPPYGGLQMDQVKRMKGLELENQRLRKAVSDLTLDKLILAEAAKGNF
jgi:mannitol/fructose-specific phosphotransferase system IIA component (Ntr-type)